MLVRRDPLFDRLLLQPLEVPRGNPMFCRASPIISVGPLTGAGSGGTYVNVMNIHMEWKLR